MSRRFLSDEQVAQLAVEHGQRIACDIDALHGFVLEPDRVRAINEAIERDLRVSLEGLREEES